MTAREVMRRVREGYRLACPQHCRSEFYNIMKRCWSADSGKRPSFSDLKEEVGILLQHQTGYIDLDNFPKDMYYHMSHVTGEKV